MNIVEQMKLKNGVERILHAPGNYTGGLLEFAVVIDCNVEKDKALSILKNVISTLKKHSEVFRNARLNMIYWIDDDIIIKEISSMANIIMGRGFEKYQNGNRDKSYDELTKQLKLFYARSKVIILITDGSYKTYNEDVVHKNLYPFLKRKLYEMKVE